MKKVLLAVAFALATLAFNGCTETSDIKVASQKSSKVDLSGFKSYEWFISAQVLVDEKSEYKGRGYDVDTYVQNAITKQLVKNGKVEKNTDPDFLVSYVSGVDMDHVQEKLDDEGKAHLKTIPEAAIAVLLIDAHNGKLIWMGVAEGEFLKKLSDEESMKRIDYAVKKMFSDF